jgi:hypothetical protein
MRGAKRRRTLEEDVDQAVEAELALLRQTIGDSVHRRIEYYAETIGLRDSEGSQFEQDLVEALLWCALTHFDAANRKRHSVIRKELLRVRREAAAAERSLDRLRDALTTLTPRYRELLDGRLELVAKIAISLVAKQAPWFYALSPVASVAGVYAEALKTADKGGAPKMFAFSALVSGLKRAFENATRRKAKVTWHEHRERYEGKFLRLVEAVLPLALAVAGNPERPMRHPDSAQSRGKYVYEATRRNRKRTARAIPKTPRRRS